jgi:hypothetical protein
MDRIVVTVAIGATLLFGTGILAGIIAVVAIAVRREDKRHTLTGEAPDAMARGARRLVGVGLRDITPAAYWEPSGFGARDISPPDDYLG